MEGGGTPPPSFFLKLDAIDKGDASMDHGGPVFGMRAMYGSCPPDILEHRRRNVYYYLSFPLAEKPKYLTFV
jgi:hypothetical protein